MNAQPTTLTASSGKADLAPPAGCWLAGYAARVEPSVALHDPIGARAVLLDDGISRLAMVSCDLIGFSPRTDAELRRRIAAAASIPAEGVLICCTHTHSSPASMALSGVMGKVDLAWSEAAGERIVKLVAGLADKLVPARLAHAGATVGGIGYNRQDRNRPFNEELGVVAVQAPDGAPIATLINYHTHAVVLGADNLLISADFPGAATVCLEKLRGGVAMYIQGSCGDVDPIAATQRRSYADIFGEVERIGRRLAEAAAEALRGAAFSDSPRICVAAKEIAVPLAALPSAGEIAAAEEKHLAMIHDARAKANKAMESWAAITLDRLAEQKKAMAMGNAPTSIPARLTVAAVGDLRVVAMPFETYGDVAAAIGQSLRPSRTIFAGYANGLYGYVYPAWAWRQGGYGPAESHRCFPDLLTPIAQGADELLIQAVGTLAKEL